MSSVINLNFNQKIQRKNAENILLQCPKNRRQISQLQQPNWKLQDHRYRTRSVAKVTLYLEREPEL